MFIFKMLLICIICARILVNVCVAELLSYLQLISLRLSFGKNSKPICNKTQLKYANKCIVRPHRMHVHSSTFALCGRRCLASSVGHGCYHITQELQWFCFTSRDSTSLGRRQNCRTLVPALNHQVFQWTVILSNQSTTLFTLAVYNHRVVNVVQT